MADKSTPCYDDETDELCLNLDCDNQYCVEHFGKLTDEEIKDGYAKAINNWNLDLLQESIDELQDFDLKIDGIEFWGSNSKDNGGIEIAWSSNVGFGAFQYYLDKDNVFKIIDDEAMGLDFANKVLNKALKLS